MSLYPKCCFLKSAHIPVGTSIEIMIMYYILGNALFSLLCFVEDINALESICEEVFTLSHSSPSRYTYMLHIRYLKAD